MVEEAFLVRDLAVVLIAAAATSVLFQRFRQPAVLGYLAAGVLVGPHVLPVPLVADAESIRTLAELGTLFLLFSLGLSFNLAKLKRVGSPAVLAAVLELGAMISAGVIVARFLGWRAVDALFLGVILSLSGASVIVKLMEELGREGLPSTQVVYGILVIERVAAVILLAVLSSILATGSVDPSALLGLGTRVGLFILVTLVVGLLVVPRLVDHVAHLPSKDTLVIAVVGLAFGMALLGSVLGLGLQLGAFIAGAVVAEAGARATIRDRVEPLRDVFVAVFFVAMGLLVVPADVAAHWLPVLALSALVVFGKSAAVAVSTFVAGYPPGQAAHAGMAMGALGAFGLVIANTGRETGLVDASLFPVVAAVTAISAFVTPILLKRSDRIVAGAGRRLPRTAHVAARTYSKWVARHRENPPALLATERVAHVTRVIAYAGVLTTLVLAFSLVQRQLAPVRVDRPLLESTLGVGAWAAFLLLAIPLTLGLARAVRRLVDDLVQLLIPPRVGAAAQHVVRNTMYAFAVVLGGTIAVAAGGFFLPPLPLLLAILVGVGVAAHFLRRSLTSLDRHVEEAIDAVLEDAPPATRDDVMAIVSHRYGQNVDVESVVVPPDGALAHRALRDAALRERSGATVIAHERDGARVLSPPPDTVLEPGDVVTLLGTPAEVDAAVRLMRSQAPRATGPRAGDGGARVEEARVMPGSPLAGVPLAESRLREATGANVIALLREGTSTPNPSPATLLKPGDVLVLLGGAEQVAAAKRLVAGKTPTRQPSRRS